MARIELQVFVERGCEQSERAVALARKVDRDYPPLAVHIIDVSQPGRQRDDVFAVPTFVLDNRVVSLGNPPQHDLRLEIESALESRGSV